MPTFKKVLQWLDENVLFLISAFLLAFIPLFPKLPLFDIIPGYIVRVRVEDFLVSFALVVWLVQLVRKKASFGPNPLVKPILAYLVVGVLSMISAVFVTQTVPLIPLHIGKMVLHFLRRVEYFSLFFVFFSGVKSMKQVKVYITILVLTVLGVTLYGYGQKYLYWPAFSTMNREFSKGWALYLTQHARVLSTFGGHYDLAAFAMIALTVLWALFFSIKQKLLRVGIFIVLAGVFWLLILTASRTSFIAYIASVTVLFTLWAFKRGIGWSFTRWSTVVILSIVIMLSFGDLSERFTKLLKLDQRLAGIKHLLLNPVGAPPTGNNIALLENNTEAVTSKSDFPPLPMRPTDVAYDSTDGIISSYSATGAAIYTKVQRTYSQAALVYDLSTGIRLDALWPRAIAGFKRNPLLGSGYSTLTKTQVSEFTEAESTDNDFLRALGETGILGFAAFGWILATIIISIWIYFTRVKDKLFLGFMMAIAAVVVGLLVNAVYIDIFEASKVAFSFWALVGIVLGGIKVVEMDRTSGKIKYQIPDLPEVKLKLKNWTIKTLRSDKTYLLLLVVAAFYVRLYKINEPLADWHSWRQADTSAVTRNYVRYGIDPMFPRFDDLSSVASGKPNPEGYRFVEFPIYNIAAVITDKLFPGYSVEHSGRLTSIFASLGSLVFIYFLVKKYFGVKTAFFAAFFFGFLPYNIFWSRVILPEPTLVFLTTASLYFFDKWVETEKTRFWSIAVVLTTLALLVKFTTLFFAIPGIYLIWKKWGKRAFYNPWLYAFGLIVITPFLAWRWHIARFPEGIPAYDWLFNGNGIRFKGAWFWWLFAERIAKLILGGWGVGLLIIGVIRAIRRLGEKKNWLFHFWGLGMLLYLIVFATGNVQHDYYQIILVPILSIFLGIGAEWLFTNPGKVFNPVMSRLVLIVCTIFVLMFGWYQARDLFNINHPEIVTAGGAFQRYMGDKKGNVIAPYGGDTAFLYQTGQRGWPLVEGTIDEMLGKNAHYYISTTYDDFTNGLLGEIDSPTTPNHQFKLIERTDQYVIVQLVPDKLLPKP